MISREAIKTSIKLATYVFVMIMFGAGLLRVVPSGYVTIDIKKEDAEKIVEILQKSGDTVISKNLLTQIRKQTDTTKNEKVN